MRIARWIGPVGHEEGFVIEDRVVPFAGDASIASVLAEGLAFAREAHAAVSGRAGHPLSEVELLVPLAPASVRDFVAFEEHVEGVSASVDGTSEVVPEWYEAPTFYFTNPHTLCATGQPVQIPETERLDFELELAAVVGGVAGSDGTNLTAGEAERHIFGYTVMNDWSARDLQAREMRVRLGPCKGKDFGTTLGPWIVTADELAGFHDDDGFLAVRGEVWVNGALIGEDLFSNMGWPFAELVAYASRNSVIVPGDVLGSGTTGNGGSLGELWGFGSTLPPLEPGDEVRMRVEGVGEIVNTVGERVRAPEVARARRRTRARRR